MSTGSRQPNGGTYKIILFLSGKFFYYLSTYEVFKIAHKATLNKTNVLEIIHLPTFLAILTILYQLHCLTTVK